MKIAEIAPPWVKVPPKRYGGIEWIVSMLADGLTGRGHDVILYATSDSTTKAHLRAPFDNPVSLGGKDFYDAVHPMAIQIMSAFLETERYDVIHDHTGALAACLGALSETPFLLTLHGPFNQDVRRLCRMARSTRTTCRAKNPA
jgi:hypothetical protein